jgi:DNA mismatch repair protein MutS
LEESEQHHERTQCKTIFATHYHERAQLADELPALRNFNVGVREVGDQELFLHRLMPGGADRSYGIEVGRLAGLPEAVIARAKQVLAVLEAGHVVEPNERSDERLATGDERGHGAPGAPPLARRQSLVAPVAQFSLFADTAHPVLEELRQVDVNALTPIQALQLLARLTDQARGG